RRESDGVVPIWRPAERFLELGLASHLVATVDRDLPLGLVELARELHVFRKRAAVAEPLLEVGGELVAHAVVAVGLTDRAVAGAHASDDELRRRTAALDVAAEHAEDLGAHRAVAI